MKTAQINKSLKQFGSFSFVVENSFKNLSKEGEEFYDIYDENDVLVCRKSLEVNKIANERNRGIVFIKRPSGEVIVKLVMYKRLELNLDKIVGSGGDAVVYNIQKMNIIDILHHYNRELCSHVAKVIDIKRPADRNLLLRDCVSIRHTNIEKMLIFIEDNKSQYNVLVSERLDIRACDIKNFSFNRILELNVNMMNALDYLHNTHRILHCDIKENNIMFSYAENCFKLIDFNNASSEREFGTFELQTTIQRKPLRLLKNKLDWGYHVDIWALGATLYSLYYKREFITEGMSDFHYQFNRYVELKQNENFWKPFYGLLIFFYENKIIELRECDSFFYLFFVCTTINQLKESMAK